MKLRALLVVATLLVLGRTARAESAIEVHTAIDDVRACTVTDDGVVLAGTAGGLAVFGSDGKLARVITALDGLPDTRIHAVLLEERTLWIGTERGLLKANVEPGGRVSLSTSFPSPPVRAIHRHDGTLYIGTWGGGVQKLGTAPSLARVPFDGETSNERSHVTALATYDGGLIGATAGAGLVRLGKAGMAPYDAARVPKTVWSLAPHGGRLWVGALEGMVSLATDAPARFEGDADTRALAGVGDTMLAGTYGKGLFRVGARDGATEIAGAKYVQAIDPRAGRCVGTRSGLYVGGVRLATSGPPENDLTAIAKDGDKLWIGTYEHGVAVLEAGRWKRIAQVDGRVNGIALDGHRAWIATARGLTMVDGETVRTYGGGGVLPSSAVHAVGSLAGGGAIVGTERGAAILKDGAVTRIDEKQGLPVRAVWAVAEGPDGVLFLGTSAGLYAGTPGGTWQRVAIVTGHLKDDWVTSLAVSGHDVFVGTYNAGVTRLAWDHGKLEPGEHLGGGYVNPAGLAIAGGTLYAATMDGLLARQVSGGGAWRTLAGASTGKDVTGVVPAGSDVWVASRRGLVRARP